MLGCWELGEVGSDECIEDCGPGSLHLPYSMGLGGSWELQIPRGCETGWVLLMNLDPRGSATPEFEVRRIWRLEVTNVFGIVALGGSAHGILRVSEDSGSSRFRVAVRPGRSA